MKNTTEIYSDINGFFFIGNTKCEIDFSRYDGLFGLVFTNRIPTKQDWFDKLNKQDISLPIRKELGELINSLYVRRGDGHELKEFKHSLASVAMKHLHCLQRGVSKSSLNLKISISTTENWINKVDVDNLAKGCLDSLNHVLYEDDRQVYNLEVSKFIHPMDVHSILVYHKRI